MPILFETSLWWTFNEMQATLISESTLWVASIRMITCSTHRYNKFMQKYSWRTKRPYRRLRTFVDGQCTLILKEQVWGQKTYLLVRNTIETAKPMKSLGTHLVNTCIPLWNTHFYSCMLSLHEVGPHKLNPVVRTCLSVPMFCLRSYTTDFD